MSKNNDIKEIKRKLRQLQKEVEEIKEIVMTYMTEPQRAILEFFGIGDSEVLTRSGLGTKYLEIIKKLAKQTNEYAKEVLNTYGENNRKDKE